MWSFAALNDVLLVLKTFSTSLLLYKVADSQACGPLTSLVSIEVATNKRKLVVLLN